ncbi:MAG: EF-hand domain-containing protein [Proteobacteria bacterium]|nr:EF-hand domain-containing protein [Pseudomonadota bacterium]
MTTAGARWIAAWGIAMCSAAALGQPVAAGDPAVPPALRARGLTESPRGAELDAIVERKLRKHFEAADQAGAGRITRAQAAAAGWGAVADQFDRIDARGVGTVSYDEIRGYFATQAREARTRR